jgi:CheY-like chemotaxis protein
LLSSRAKRPLPSELKLRGIAASELKPIHAERLRSIISRSLLLTRPPIVKPEPPAIPAKAGVVPGGRANILVAEDNSVNQRVALLQLRSLGYRADVVSDGQQAVTAVKSGQYAIVLMDQQMPVMDGLEATRQIRAAQKLGLDGIPAEMRIVAMTANAMPSDRQRCIEAGMDHFIPKPIRIELLRDVLSQYLSPHASVPVAVN